MTQTHTDRAMRADAVRNREKLLAAATELFAAGTDVPLEAVAKRAGVGIGTLYRHYSTREDLVAAAYRKEVERLHDAAAELLRDHPPDVALAEWMDRFVTYAAAKRGMLDALRCAFESDSGLKTDARGQILDALGTLLDAGTAAGTIRADVTPDDVARAMGGIWVMPDGPDWPEQARRLLGLVMDGLRYGARS
jgi:AcrR family transcriptional regulator